MTQEQRAQEMEKIQRMSPQERNRILTQNGIDLTAFQEVIIQHLQEIQEENLIIK